MTAENGAIPFQPKARLIKLLGDELISNEVIALVELVKNSYDADATSVEVLLENITDIDNGKIIVRDNGTGMSKETVLGAWLQPGTDIKKRFREGNQRTKVYGRPVLGEKGVGRFAAQKLGSLITLITKTKEDKLETLVEIDWKEFEKDKPLSDILVKWIRVEPKIFRGEMSGTFIQIQFLNKKWNEKIVSKLIQKLGSLQSPFKEKANFRINLTSNDYPHLVEEVKFPKSLFEQAVYSLCGTVTKTGVLKGEYHFHNPAYKNLERKVTLEKDIRDPEDFSSNDFFRYPCCGDFSFDFYVWDLDPLTLKETISRKNYCVFIQPHTGVRIYRDNFRAWPYGEEGDDWLDLNHRRVNNMPKCLSNNQIIGVIEISQEGNPQLRDKTNREGFLENQEYTDFQSLVTSAINELEILRRQDKDKTDRLRERSTGKRIDQTIDEIKKLDKRIRKNNHCGLYSENLRKIEAAHNNYLSTTVQNLYVMAGIGVAALMPAHEIQIQVKDLKPLLIGLKEQFKSFGVGNRILGQFEEIDKIVSTLKEVSEGALELGKREHKVFSLHSVVNFSLKIKEPELRRSSIRFVVIEKAQINLKGYPNLVMTALNNLIDNSIWWLQTKSDPRTLRITIKRDGVGNPLIVVSDNGPGINPEDIPYLGDAFYTRKPKGTGLGLFITKRAMEANGGKVEFGFYPTDPDYLEGANVLLIFDDQKLEVQQ